MSLFAHRYTHIYVHTDTYTQTADMHGKVLFEALYDDFWVEVVLDFIDDGLCKVNRVSVCVHVCMYVCMYICKTAEMHGKVLFEALYDDFWVEVVLDVIDDGLCKVNRCLCVCMYVCIYVCI